MRLSAILLLTAFLLLAFIVFKKPGEVSNSPGKRVPDSKLPVPGMRNSAISALKNYAVAAKAYTIAHGFNSRYCFLVDMKMASGSKRFFIYDLVSDSVLRSGLVTNGSGVDNLTGSVQFSNELNSNCTSAGKYKIGKPYYGKFGLAYKLFGLDKTNTNAFKRYVVLHSHACVPDREIAPLQICTSWGCPTISPAFLNQLKVYIGQSKGPVLLWIYK